MENIKVPKSVEEKLLEGERVVGKISNGGADFYATDKRLLRFTSASDYWVLEYSQISSIKLTKHVIRLTIFRLLAAILGLYFIAIGINSFIDPDMISTPFGAKILLFVIGAAAIIFAIISDVSYYQITAPDFDNKDYRRWRLQQFCLTARNVKKFLKLIEEKRNPAHAD